MITKLKWNEMNTYNVSRKHAVTPSK